MTFVHFLWFLLFWSAGVAGLFFSVGFSFGMHSSASLCNELLTKIKAVRDEIKKVEEEGEGHAEHGLQAVRNVLAQIKDVL